MVDGVLVVDRLLWVDVYWLMVLGCFFADIGCCLLFGAWGLVLVGRCVFVVCCQLMVVSCCLVMVGH